jgi:hypothetical protein
VCVLCMTAHYVYCLRCYTHEFLKDFFLSTGQLQVCLNSLRSMIMYVSLCVCMYMCACVCVSKKFL